jgi:osmotically-inducible protein OsmY
MERLMKTLAAAVIVVTGISVAGCTTIVTSAAQKAWEDRSTEDQVTDAKITTGIIDGMTDIDKGLLLDVAVDVWEQRVMLTGTLDSTKARNAVDALAKGDNRVKALYNEIQVVTTAEVEARREQAKKKDEEEEGGAVNDFWLETKIKAQLLTSGGVNSVNYFWRSVRGTVYIVGRSGTTAERDKVLATIRGTEGVKGVKSFIQIIPVS